MLVTTVTHQQLVTRVTNSKQKTLESEMVREKGRGTPLPLDLAGSERSEDLLPREKGKKRGGRGKGRGRAQYLCESSKEQTVTTDDPSEGGFAAEKREEEKKDSSPALSHPPPTTALSMVVSEERFLREKSGTSGTFAMETIESPNIDSPGAGDDHVIEAERSRDRKFSSPPSRGSTYDVQSDCGSSGTPSVVDRERGRGRKRVKTPATPHMKITATPKLLTRGLCM